MGDLNETIPYYEPGQRLTAECEAAVVGKTFVDISDDIESGPGLSLTAEGGNITISTATEDGIALGVASHDAAIGKKVTVIVGGVVPVTASGAIADGAEVQVGPTGKALTFTDGRAVGRCLTTAANGEDAMILLYGVSLPAPA